MTGYSKRTQIRFRPPEGAQFAGRGKEAKFADRVYSGKMFAIVLTVFNNTVKKKQENQGKEMRTIIKHLATLYQENPDFFIRQTKTS